VKTILAIDAAWTVTEPSGIALLRGMERDWTCVGLAPSQAQFQGLADRTPVDWSAKPTGHGLLASELVDAAQVLLDGAAVDVVTIDMPISTAEISGRREADSAVSKEFGASGCGTHSPNAVRPGAISGVLRDQFAEFGLPIATSATPTGTSPALVEVYPHPALLVLMNAVYRVPYKIAKVARYWPTLSPSERRRKVVQTWHEIYAALAVTISGAELPLPGVDAVGLLGNAGLKRYEDALDALVCGWIGIAYLQRRCVPYGDATAAIWTPPIAG
jgi:predicted RNase H-like nuclease